MAKKKPPIVSDVQIIRDLKTEYKDFYATKIKEQQTDQKYADDDFPVDIHPPYHIVRTGAGARVIDIACESIDTSNPVAFCELRKASDKEKERATKKAKLLNHWLPQLSEEISEAKKNAMNRGEAFFQVEYNNNYDPNGGDNLPVIITAPDPMIIYPDPYEVNGVPRKAIKSCNMAVGQVQQLFPQWTNPKNRKANDRSGVDYLAYWDAGTRYIEIDGEAALGIQPNIFGFTPFAHCYSGFGKRSPEGKPEAKVVGRLRRVRGSLKEECEMASRLDSIIGLYANPVIRITYDPNVPPNVAGDPPDEDSIRYIPGAVIQETPGWKVFVEQPQVPGPQMYQHLYQIRAMLGVETPPIAMGLPSTSRATGRQEDIYAEQYTKQYRTCKKNLEKALSTALSMGLKILDTVPGLLPITIRATSIENGKEVKKEEIITKDDIDGYYDCRVEFRAPDELINDRRVMLGRGLIGEGRIDWKSFLVDYCGYSQEKAEETINQTIADMVIFSPQMINVIAKEALEKVGAEKFIKELEAQSAKGAEMARSPIPQTKARPSEARNPEAREITRQMLEQTPYGQRRMPSETQSLG